MTYSHNWLKTTIENGYHPDYLFFWGHTQKTSGAPDKSCLSQWWPSPFMVEGITYPTAEHRMMAKKALLFEDEASFKLILQANKPAIAKDLGRSVKNFDADPWNAGALAIVTEGNLHKFSQHEALKQFLLHTGDKILAEASPVDLTWGIGLSQDTAVASDPFEWRGSNLLGFALMEVRDQLKN